MKQYHNLFNAQKFIHIRNIYIYMMCHIYITTGELVLLSGTVNVTGDLSVNGPSLLGGGITKVGAGANVYYNDAKERRKSYTEDNNGNILNMEYGER